MIGIYRRNNNELIHEFSNKCFFEISSVDSDEEETGELIIFVQADTSQDDDTDFDKCLVGLFPFSEYYAIDEDYVKP